MHLDDLDDGDDILACPCADCLDDTRRLIDRIHEAMLLAQHAGFPIGSTDGSYVEMIAHQSDVDVDEAGCIIQETLDMARPGSPGRNSNLMYH